MTVKLKGLCLTKAGLKTILPYFFLSWFRSLLAAGSCKLISAMIYLNMCLSCFKDAILTILILFFFTLCSCNHGLQPTEENISMMSGISGTIYYVNWPSEESIYDLRLVVFNRYPPGDIFDELGKNRAHVYPAIGQAGLPFPVDSTTYIMELDSGYYEYVVLAQQYGSNVFQDWLAAGQYDTLFTDEIPTPIQVRSGEILEHVDIHVDFDNLPPQPF